MTLQESYPDLERTLVPRLKMDQPVDGNALSKRVMTDIEIVRNALSQTNQKQGSDIEVPIRLSDDHTSTFNYVEVEREMPDGFRLIPGGAENHESSLDGLAARIERELLEGRKNSKFTTIDLRELPIQFSQAATDLCRLIVGTTKRLGIDDNDIGVGMKYPDGSYFSTSPVGYLMRLKGRD